MEHSVKLCCFPECKRMSRNRGLCYSHYNKFRHRVNKGETSWEQLEGEGLSKPVEPQARKRWCFGRGVLQYRGKS